MTTTDFWDKVTDFAQQATHAVGQELMKAFGSATAEQKADGSLVTKYDKWADADLTKRISAAFADHGILSEAAAHTCPDTDWCWIIDPIDGTTNFTRACRSGVFPSDCCTKARPFLAMCTYRLLTSTSMAFGPATPD